MTDQSLNAALEPTQADIEKLRDLLAKATPGSWETDSEYDGDGHASGGGGCTTGWHNYFVGAEVDGKWRTLLDTVNSDHKLIEDDRDEDGGRSWDAIGEANANLVAAAINALPHMLDELSRHRLASSSPAAEPVDDEALTDAMNEILQPFHWEAWKAALFSDHADGWPNDDEQDAICRRVDDVAVGEHYQAWSEEVREKIATLYATPLPPPPAGDAELRKVMDALWPVLGGNHTDAQLWQEINDALTPILATPPSQDQKGEEG